MHPAITNHLLILLTIIGATSFVRGGALQPLRPHGGVASCLPSERAALLDFKKGITSDPANILSSWSGWDCCCWRGVTCSNRPGHVLKLHLANPYRSMDNSLIGEINPSLLSLEHLEHLDLSQNSLLGADIHIPRFLGSMRNLRYLNLADIHFAGTVPPQFGNLSKLQYLELGNTVRGLTDINWITNLPMLQYLCLSAINLSLIADWPQKINMIPSIRVVDLSFCHLDRADQSLLNFNLTKLEHLDLSINGFNQTIATCWFWKATSLKDLYLRDTLLFGQFNNSLENMTSLQVLDMSNLETPENMMDHYTTQMIGSFKNLCSLQILDLTFTYNSGDITVFMEGFPQCAWGELQELYLGSNNFTGNLSDFIARFTSLRTLDLQDNNLSGRIPPGLGNCTRLRTLEMNKNNLNGIVPIEIGTLTNLTVLFLCNNQLSGVITEEHFKGLASLKELDLSYNNNLKVIVEEGWFPPFKLEHGGFASCQIGPLFPAWLQWQLSIDYLDISSTGVKDKIPDWFWSTVSQTTYLDMSDNELTGSLPSRLANMALTDLNLSSNHLTGSIQPFPINIFRLDISNNSFSGVLPLSFEAPELTILHMFLNKIGGSIPNSMCNLTKLLVLDVSSNLLEGEIPQCFSKEDIAFLLLSNNSFLGIFPTFLHNSTRLTMLDLSWNKFSGRLPTWIGELTSLSFLRLSHNMFSGIIPLEIVYLWNLQFLDLSDNNLSGVIPHHLENLTGMTTLTDTHSIYGRVINKEWPGGETEIGIQEDQFDELLLIITKGQQRQYGKGLDYFVSIDLSDNSLSGEIPSNIVSLDALINLNLSSNDLSGQIPNKIGAMKALECFDLSINNLSGEIPLSLSNLTSLSYMNLSYNNLSGRIPSGRQLDTLNADKPSIMYIGNSALCGPPLPKKCSGNGSLIYGNGTIYKQEFEPLSFYLGLLLGVLVGLWMVFCALLFKKTWRVAYFRLFDKFYDTIYVYVVLMSASMTRKTVLE